MLCILHPAAAQKSKTSNWRIALLANVFDIAALNVRESICHIINEHARRERLRYQTTFCSSNLKWKQQPWGLPDLLFADINWSTNMYYVLMLAPISIRWRVGGKTRSVMSNCWHPIPNTKYAGRDQTESYGKSSGEWSWCIVPYGSAREKWDYEGAFE